MSAAPDLGWNRIQEYRIVLPTTIPQYRIGNLYMVNRIAREDKGGGEGIEILTNEPYEKGEERGVYTHKIYHIKSKIPAAFRWAVPDSYLHFHEESWNSYPHFLTTWTIPGKEKDFFLHIESQHFPYTRGSEVPENSIGLDAEELKKRKIVYLDIVGHDPKPDPPEFDLLNFTCPEAGIANPLTEPKPDSIDFTKLPKWIDSYDGEMMICCKVVKFRFHWKVIQGKVRNFVMDSTYPGLFSNVHRKLISWIGVWGNWTQEDLAAYEAETERLQREYFAEQPPT
jgi:hypothetical protein